MTTKPLLMRPVEITATTDEITFQKSGGTERSVTIEQGVYASMLSVCRAYVNAAQASAFYTTDGVATTITTEISSDGTELVIKFTYTSSSTISFVNTTTRNLFGANNISNGYATSFTCENRPQYTWIPRYQVTNQDYWNQRHKDLFAGSQTKTGLIVGISTGPTIYKRKLDFVNEPAANVFDEAASSAVEQTKNLMYFVNGSISSYPSDPTYPTTRGFWFWPNWNDAIGNTSNIVIPGGDDGEYNAVEGISYGISDLYTWCNFSPDGLMGNPTASAPTGKMYYQVSIDVHTCTIIPSFEPTTA